MAARAHIFEFFCLEAIPRTGFGDEIARAGGINFELVAKQTQADRFLISVFQITYIIHATSSCANYILFCAAALTKQQAEIHVPKDECGQKSICGDDMKVSSCMKRNVVSISITATILEAAKIIAEKHIGLLPIVDENEKAVGVLGLGDLLNLELPDFVRFLSDVDFVHDFGAVEDTRPSAATLNQTVERLMRPPVTVDQDSGLLRTYALMLQHDLHDIPVVSKNGKLIGIASRVDIGVAILSTWQTVAQ
jgi:CBS domain-containing protein